ncbi:MAG: hypothetical protein A3H42_01715 [Deltaproteobacteria bacterium RIFCSPLOWO2_02_FULL_46_8]|nr:MAG: hypothetical protein A3H42_01715 [Deltaproteobacteria bacterium RIFCSPLOWO2_02_FULL_46_8]
MKPRCVILGAGGHAKVVLDCLEATQKMEVAAVLDSNPKLWGQEILGIPIRGSDDLLTEIFREGIRLFFVGVGSIRETTVRQKLYEKALTAGLDSFALLHPKAICSPRTQIGKGSLLCAGAVLNVGVVLGQNVIINTGAIVDHDCRIDNHVHIAPGVTLSGSVWVQTGAHVGTGASVRQNIIIGKGAVVGAGAVVVKNVPAGAVVKGIPAR